MYFLFVLNAHASSLLDFEKDFEEGRALDINMNLSAKELSSVRYQEKADYDSLALYVEVSFSMC
jgi:hypothetical protein